MVEENTEWQWRKAYIEEGGGEKADRVVVVQFLERGRCSMMKSPPVRPAKYEVRPAERKTTGLTEADFPKQRHIQHATDGRRRTAGPRSNQF